MKFKYRLERCRLDGVKETTDRLTALGGQGWRAVSTAHHGAELFILMELDMSIPDRESEQQEPRRGPGRPKKADVTAGTVAASSVTSSIGPVEVFGSK